MRLGPPALATALLLLTAGCLSAERAPAPAPGFTLTTLEGASLNLTDFEGRVVLLDLMGTTCGPCILSMPHFRAFAAAHPEVAILSVGADPTDTDEDLRAFREKFNATWAFARDTDRVFERYGARGIPSLYVIDGAGRLVAAHEAKAVTRSDLEAMVAPHLEGAGST